MTPTRRPARKPKPPVRWVVVSEPPTAAQLAHKAKLEAEGFAVRFISEAALAQAG